MEMGQKSRPFSGHKIATHNGSTLYRVDPLCVAILRPESGHRFWSTLKSDTGWVFGEWVQIGQVLVASCSKVCRGCHAASWPETMVLTCSLTPFQRCKAHGCHFRLRVCFCMWNRTVWMSTCLKPQVDNFQSHLQCHAQCHGMLDRWV